MSNRIDLMDCRPTEVISFRYYDERRSGMVNATVAILTKGPIVVTVRGRNETVRSYRFERTRLGPLTLPNHVALAGTMFLVGDGPPEVWTIKNDLRLVYHPVLAGQLRHIGREQTGVELAH